MNKTQRKPHGAPTVVLLGRTNAGKSTLFNRLTEEGKAIVSSAENTTRDQNRDFIYWKGSMCELVDTGGLDMAAFDLLDQDIQHQVQTALKDSAAVLFVVDGRYDLMPQDREVAHWLQKIGKPVVLCINKMDNRKRRAEATGIFDRLGFKHEVMCSAINGSGTGDLLDELFSVIPATPSPEQKSDDDSIRVTFVGRPNVGKSSLFNALAGEKKVIVSDLPHTTRDPNDSELIYNDKTFTIIDTAGIRRKNRVGEWDSSKLGQIEKQSVQKSLNSIERAHVVVLLVEAQLKVTNQDKTLLDYAQRHSKGIIVAVNKWDMIPDKDPAMINDYIKYFRTHLELGEHIPIIFISALTRQRSTAVLDLAEEVHAYEHMEAAQADLDAVLRTVLSHNPKQRQIRGQAMMKKPLVLVSMKQIDTNPPTFRVVTPHPKEVAPAVIHLIEKGIRTRCKYVGVPINLVVRNS